MYFINVWNKYNVIYKNEFKKRIGLNKYHFIDIDWVFCSNEFESYVKQLNNLFEVLKKLDETPEKFKGILFFHSLVFPTIVHISLLNKNKYLIVGWCDENLGYIDKSIIGKNQYIKATAMWRFWFEKACLYFYDLIFCENEKVRQILCDKYLYGALYYKVYSIGLPYAKEVYTFRKKRDNIIVFPYYNDFMNAPELFDLAKKKVNEIVKEPSYNWVKVSPVDKDYNEVLRKAKFGLSFNRRFGNDYGIRDCIMNNVLVFIPAKKYRKKIKHNIFSRLEYTSFDNCIKKLVNVIQSNASYKAYKSHLTITRALLKKENNRVFTKIRKILKKFLKEKFSKLQEKNKLCYGNITSEC